MTKTEKRTGPCKADAGAEYNRLVGMLANDQSEFIRSISSSGMEKTRRNGLHKLDFPFRGRTAYSYAGQGTVPVDEKL